MNQFKNLLAASLLAFLCFTNVVFADDKATVQFFYDFLSNPASEDHAAALKDVMSDDWESIGKLFRKEQNRRCFFWSDRRFR